MAKSEEKCKHFHMCYNLASRWFWTDSIAQSRHRMPHFGIQSRTRTEIRRILANIHELLNNQYYLLFSVLSQQLGVLEWKPKGSSMVINLGRKIPSILWTTNSHTPIESQLLGMTYPPIECPTIKIKGDCETTTIDLNRIVSTMDMYDRSIMNTTSYTLRLSPVETYFKLHQTHFQSLLPVCKS